jgi:putative transferase (TIGR04331 family)
MCFGEFMKKRNFIVSYLKELWIKESDKLFVSDPYIHYLLKKNKEELNYNSIEVAEFLRTNREQMDEAIDFIQLKYDKYIPILAKRFNEIHNTTYKDDFWKKCFSFAFFRYLTIFHDLFSKCEKNFDPQKHCCQVLAEGSYYIPIDFEDHFRLTATTHFGQEQIFSHYINLFFPNQFPNYNFEIDLEKNESSRKPSRKYRNLKFFAYCYKVLRIGSKAAKYLMLLRFKEIYSKVYLWVSSNSPQRIKIGLLNAYFSAQHINTLMQRSKGAIQHVEVERSNQSMYDAPIDWDKRDLLGICENNFDRFDQFIFSTFPSFMPKAFIENFGVIHKANMQRINLTPQLKYVVGEGWQASTYDSMALAIMKEEKGIKHVYNEHNAFTHCYTGKLCHQTADLVDHFLTMGWCDNSIPNLVKGASLFPFAIENTFKKQYQLLYVSNSPEARMYHYGGLYGTMGINALKHLERSKIFLGNLGSDNLKKASYRGHPKAYTSTRLVYDYENYCEEYLSQMTIVTPFNKESETCKKQMCKSRLVVVDNVSTVYLEAMSMNIPIVCFWNSETYYLEDHYSEFFQPLINVGICQTDPVKAAQFVDKIIDNPEKWWFSDETQDGKNNFLNSNMGKPEVMIDYLLSLSN